jgi:hypothetical protein
MSRFERQESPDSFGLEREKIGLESSATEPTDGVSLSLARTPETSDFPLKTRIFMTWATSGLPASGSGHPRDIEIATI